MIKSYKYDFSNDNDHCNKFTLISIIVIGIIVIVIIVIVIIINYVDITFFIAVIIIWQRILYFWTLCLQAWDRYTMQHGRAEWNPSGYCFKPGPTPTRCPSTPRHPSI